jgi:hypothetical protein
MGIRMSFKYHLLFVGVNNGIEPEQNLESAEKDAGELASEFEQLRLSDAGRIVVLTDQRATHENIEHEFDTIQSLKGYDLLLIYWAGHLLMEGNSYYLVTTDTEKSDQYNTKMCELSRVIRSFCEAHSINHRVMIFDVCYAARLINEHNKINIDRNPHDGKVYLFAGCGYSQKAWETDEHGIFTGILINKFREKKQVCGAYWISFRC